MNKKSKSKIIRKKIWISNVNVKVDVKDNEVLAILTSAELATFLYWHHQSNGLRYAIGENERLRRDLWDKIGEKYNLDVTQPNHLSVNLNTGEIRILFEDKK